MGRRPQGRPRRGPPRAAPSGPDALGRHAVRGERTRLALAAIITRRPDCVLLDEPTNHLDDEAMAFVEDFVVSCAGVVVVASHDRVFLDKTAAVIVDLDPFALRCRRRGWDEVRR